MKQFAVLVIFSALLLFNSCTDATHKNVYKPNDLISRDTLIPLLKEITLLESYYQYKYGHIAFFHQALKRGGMKILTNYHIPYNRFERSMDYYGSHLSEMQSIYSEVLDSLNREASNLESLPKKVTPQETESSIHPVLPSPF